MRGDWSIRRRQFGYGDAKVLHVYVVGVEKRSYRNDKRSMYVSSILIFRPVDVRSRRNWDS